MVRFSLLRLVVPLIGCSVFPAYAQDLDRGKSPAQVFSSNCSGCHRGPQGLSKAGDVRATATFLLQHYTTNAESAGAIAAYLVAVGGDPRTARLRPSPTETPETPPRAAAPQSPDRDERRERAVPGEPSNPAAAARARRRKSGEPATVSSDPSPIITSSDPVPLVQERVAVQTPGRQLTSPAPSPPRGDPPAAATPVDNAPSVAPLAERQAVPDEAPTAAPAQTEGASTGPTAPAAEPKQEPQEGFSSPLP